jgi:predicted Ser/Thr protein kinase
MMELKLSWHSGSRECTRFLFLSCWSGKPLSECVDPVNRQTVVEQAANAVREMHKLGVLHCDAEIRNILYDSDMDKTMIIDFERSMVKGREPLASINPNGQGRKRKRKDILKKDKARRGRFCQRVAAHQSFVTAMELPIRQL